MENNYFNNTISLNGYVTSASETLYGGHDSLFGSNVQNEVSLTDLHPTVGDVVDDFDSYLQGLDSLKTASTIQTSTTTLNTGSNPNMISPSLYGDNNTTDSFYEYQNLEDSGDQLAYGLFESLVEKPIYPPCSKMTPSSIVTYPSKSIAAPLSMPIPPNPEKKSGNKRKLEEYLDPEDEAKRRKNNEAVKKSRQKAKEREDQMQKEFKEMKEDHARLQTLVKSLESELDKVKRQNYIQEMVIKNFHQGRHDQQY